MNTLPRFLLFLAVVLSACDREPQAPANLPPEAAVEYLELRRGMQAYTEEKHDHLDEVSPFFGKEPEYIALNHRILNEMLELFSRYEASGDATLCTPTMRQTLLHFAVQFRKESLVKALLQQGADPNARCDLSYMGHGELDAPLVWTVLPYEQEEGQNDKPFQETAIRLIDTLVAAGARLDDETGGHTLLMLSLTCREGAEDVYLHLLSRGAAPHQGYLIKENTRAYTQQAISILARHRWAHALAKLMDLGYITADFRNQEEKTLLFSLVEELLFQLHRGECRLETKDPEALATALQKEGEELLALIRMLLERGASPNAPQGGGWTPVNYAVCVSPVHSSHPDTAAAIALYNKLVALLLRYGGDRNALVPAHQGKPACRVAELLPEL